VNAAPLVPPADAVRVWRGFRAASMAQPDFYARLQGVFIPATVELQIKVGLSAYVPSVSAGLPDKPDTVPDETAILFWESQPTYRDAFKTLAVRTYTLTHAAVYTPASGADFPTLFAGRLEANKPTYLVEQPADWMRAPVRHFLGSRRSDVSPETFRDQLATALGVAQQSRAGAIACAGDDYVAYWELGSGPPDTFDALARCSDWSTVLAAAPTELQGGLWDAWPGLQLKPGDSLNLQFRRRSEQ